MSCNPFKSFAIFGFAIAAAFIPCHLSHAEIVFFMSFSNSSPVTEASIEEGTESVDAFLFVDATGDDAGEAFDAFTYAIQATNSGSAVPAFEKPIDISNLNSLMRESGNEWGIVDQSSDSGVLANQVAGNVSAPAGSGLTVPFGIAAMRITLQTSNLVAGDIVDFDANFGSSISNGADDLGGNGNFDFRNGSLSIVSAVPEPAGAVILSAMALGFFTRRRRI